MISLRYSPKNLRDGLRFCEDETFRNEVRGWIATAARELNTIDSARIVADLARPRPLSPTYNRTFLTDRHDIHD